mmetsp:Transcript_6277/g.13793  ORF Transcript_6277/g.13793 Transcript_6277/m.13793 type:complete len:367 (-) Transcript_6277:332-1432(-)
MEISLVVGRMPSARNLLPSSALITLLLPLLNSPTTTTRNRSSSCLSASRSSCSSARSGTTSSRNAITSPRAAFSSLSSSSRSSFSSRRTQLWPVSVPGGAASTSAITSVVEGFPAGGAAGSAGRPSRRCSTAAAAVPGERPATVVPVAASARRGSSGSQAATPSSPSGQAAARASAEVSGEVQNCSTGMRLPLRWLLRALSSTLRDAGSPSLLVTSTRLAPSAAAATAASPLLTMRPTSAEGPAADIMRLATTVGTPLSVSSTPSASAADAMSVRSTSSRLARLRKKALSLHAASYSTEAPEAPSVRMTAVAPDATASPIDSRVVGSDVTASASNCTINAGSCTVACACPAGKRPIPDPGWALHTW